MNHSDYNGLIQVFRSIDENGDGKLSQAELVKQYSKLMPKVKAQKIVQKIMKEVDIDHNGFIDYSEFLMAASRRETLLNNQYLELAFGLFDKRSTGYIGVQELRDVLGDSVNGEAAVWEGLITPVDSDGNGLIDIQEFKEMMVSQ